MSRIPDFRAIRFEGETVSSCPGHDWLTPEGLTVKTCYWPDDMKGIDFLHTWPGAAPFLRGPYPTMYTTQPWTIRQYAGFSTAEDSNAFYRRNLAAGQMGLSIAFDLATHRGYDSDHPRVAGDVGMAGVAIDSIYDMRTLFDGIPLDKMTVSMTMNGAVLPVMALYIVAGEEQGVPPEKLAGTIQNDILKEFMVRNTFIYPPAASMRIVSDIFRYTSERMPKFNSISISGYHMQEAGATADLELGLYAGRRAGICACGRGRGPADRQVRAAAVLLLGHRHELLHGSGQDARGPHDLGQADPALRPEGRAFAQPAHPLPDERLEPCGTGCVQQRDAHLHRGDGGNAGRHPVAAHQFAGRGAGAADRFLGPHRAQHAALPAAGGGYLPGDRPVGRKLLRRAPHRRSGGKAWHHIEEIEKMGGMAKAIEAGIPKSRIEEAAARTQARIDTGEQAVIGVNNYPVREDAKIDILKVDNSAVRARQIEKLTAAAQGAERVRDARQCWRASPRWRGPAMAICSPRRSMRRGPRRRSARSRWPSKRVWNRHTPAIRAVKGIYAATPRDKHKIEPRQACSCRLPRGRWPARRQSSSPRWARMATTAGRR